uniref:Uncharacterized protein n=1 Tax=Oryza barthii TaxID=65489 RepID=A0A0D3HAL3_9ORYZ
MTSIQRLPRLPRQNHRALGEILTVEIDPTSHLPQSPLSQTPTAPAPHPQPNPSPTRDDIGNCSAISLADLPHTSSRAPARCPLRHRRIHPRPGITSPPMPSAPICSSPPPIPAASSPSTDPPAGSPSVVRSPPIPSTPSCSSPPPIPAARSLSTPSAPSCSSLCRFPTDPPNWAPLCAGNPGGQPLHRHLPRRLVSTAEGIAQIRYVSIPIITYSCTLVHIF